MADSVTLTPITFMEADEVKHQKLGTEVVRIFRHVAKMVTTLTKSSFRGASCWRTCADI